MEKFHINLINLLSCLSTAQDLVNNNLAKHQQQVAYLSFRIAEEMVMSNERKKHIFFAALIHDIGALSSNERLEIIDDESSQSIHQHAFKGAALLEDYPYLKQESQIIKYHHMPWDHGNGRTYKDHIIPYESHIIHLADRVVSMLKTKQNILTQLPKIINHINDNIDGIYEVRIAEAFTSLSKKEYIWLDLTSFDPIAKVSQIGEYDSISLDIDEIIKLSHIFSRVIDFRSRFTTTHSAGVAVVAESLASLANFSQIECKMMLVAGFLHDLGKLAIKNSVLEKPEKLDSEEFNQMRSHTYYTYQLLDFLPGFDTIKIWASYHHEKLDGNGYPFHISGENLTLGSRIMAVADIFTAVSENRPYRLGMEDNKVVKTIQSLVNNKAIDGYVVDLLINNYDFINKRRISAQTKAAEAYDDFLNSCHG
ncbi:MAG: HD domain-containing protein [Erysipelotrichaceae bacterium]|nr:HD domain-containing protein [Erysipelotrichaceae bacterium]MDD3924051.1 HD domain-containing protein [Erysipelotrichaceae bacterium]MDD4642335.1 HD domain-containing protein [Erysipelotrichaceae bacterium]